MEAWGLMGVFNYDKQQHWAYKPKAPAAPAATNPAARGPYAAGQAAAAPWRPDPALGRGTQAMGPLDQSAPKWSTPTSPMQGLLDKPGYGEQWYESNKGAWDQPSQASQYWAGVAGQFGGGKVLPQNTQGAYKRLEDQKGAPGQGYYTAQGAAGRLGSDQPWSGETQIRDSLDFFGNSGQGETNAYGSLDYFNRPGEMEQAYGDIASMLGSMTYGDQAQRAAKEAAGRATGTQNLLPEMLDFSRGDPIGSEYRDYFAGGLRDKGYTENLYESGNEGLNTYYSREADKLQKRLNDQAAAMGMFGSGFNMRANQEGLAELGAQQARDMADLAKSADAARLARGSQALDFTRSSDQSQQGRRALGLESAKASDEGIRSNADLSMRGLKQASDEQLERARLMTGAASAAQDRGIARTTAGVDAGLKADRQGLDRTNSGVEAGATLDSLLRDRLTRSGEMGLAADDSDLKRALGLFEASQGADRTALDYERFGLDKTLAGGTLAAAADVSERQRLQGGQDAASTAQRQFESRLAQAFDVDMQTARALSDIVREASNASTGDAVAAARARIEAVLASAGLSAAQAQAKANELMQTLGILQQGAMTYAGGKK